MAKRHALLFLLSLISRTGDAATFGPAELARALPETYCFTYLSTFLELASLPTAAIPPGATVTVIGGSTVTIPSVIGGTTVDVPGPGATTTVSGAGTTVTVTGAETTVRPSPSASARAVSVPIIFFVNAAPATNRGPQKQGLQKRDYGGFLNNEVANNRGSCDFASNFTISALGQLLEAGNPVFYIPGETFKEMRSAGVPPPNAITGTFDNNNGVLRIVNPELPNGEANFCQVLTGQVYLTFNSTGPPGCQPVLLYAYNLFRLTPPLPPPLSLPGDIRILNRYIYIYILNRGIYIYLLNSGIFINRNIYLNRGVYINTGIYINRGIYINTDIFIHILSRDIFINILNRNIHIICYAYNDECCRVLIRQIALLYQMDARF
ncbi:uncharacterized protein GLRG_08504 [Colletotrichum graminicola M1.001]|uniref:DUF7908 domain-containing protein n=1 Tax=Colletotrichum graminicola (strain M1.001 / M2 / FGSC 10212) TaxID=645133 RepID=E3QRT7_COLGM|nr:uncharacterized protein GLRG_08504 [Colletotrichum graminicola M1.001]EFQ33575.1 hypothetical protein GLRG_08504 [Colletotrichum graminicola M1.001]